MGWMSWNIGMIRSRKTIDDIFRNEIVGKNFEVLKSCCRGYTWWVGAIRDKTTGQVWAGISKYHYNGKSGEFAYKWMDESYGPGYYKYPKSYFKLLTPTDCEYANEWRAEVQKDGVNKYETVKRFDV